MLDHVSICIPRSDMEQDAVMASLMRRMVWDHSVR